MPAALLSQAETTAQTVAAAPDLVADLAASAQQDALGAWEGLRSADVAAAWPLIEKYLLPVAMAVAVLVVGLILSKVAGKLVAGMTRRAKIDETLARFFAKLVFYAGAALTVVSTISYLGIPTASFAAILAAAGFAIGMAMSGTLSSFAAGVMLLIFRPFKVGDVITAAGVTAKVHEIELFTTTFDTFDNRRFVVPNAKIFGDTIENISHHAVRRVDVNVGVAYAADLDETRAVLNAAADALAELRIEGEGRGHQVYLLELGASSVNWVVRFWTPAKEFWNTKEKLTRSVKLHLNDAGLSIPFPQMEVHLRRIDDAA